MPKTSRQPFIDQTNTANMNSAKTGKRNTSKITTRKPNAAKKTKTTESEGHLLKDVDKNDIKTSSKSSPNEPKVSSSEKISKSDNLPIGKTKLSQKMSKVNAGGTSRKTTRNPIEESKSNISPQKLQTLTSKIDSKACDNKPQRKCRLSKKISNSNIVVNKSETTAKATKSIKANNRLKVKKGISKTNIAQEEESPKIILKQLKVILTRYIPNNQTQKATLSPNLQKDKEHHLQKEQKSISQQPCPENSVPSNLKKHNTVVISTKTKSDTIPSKVTINSNSQEDKDHYGLRQGRKVNFNYCEEYALDSSSEKSKLEMVPVHKKTHSVPIYKNAISELPQDQLKTEDLYEFTDVTLNETKKLKKKRPHNSSIVFDKDTHKIMQKLEKKEARAKKRIQPKKKPYEKIIGDIVSNVMQKITKKEQNNPLITKLGNTDVDFASDLAMEFIDSHAPSTSTNQTPELSSTINKNNLQNVAVKKPLPKYTILSNELVIKRVAKLAIAKNNILSEDLPSTSTANSLQNVAVRKPVPELSFLSDKLLDASATVPEIDHRSILSEDLPTIYPCTKQVPKSRIAMLRKDLLTTSTPNGTSKLCNNSVTDTDINSCFGFDDDYNEDVLPLANLSTPLDETLGSPLEFNAQKPNANSTMVGVQYNSRPSRAEGPRMSYFNCKGNGLPSGNQQIFIDHTIAESFERTPSKTPLGEETPAKRPAVQQSILDYVDHNDHPTEHPTNQKKMCEVSLYNIEELQSPKKKKQTHIENVNVAKRNIQFPAGSSIKRKPLGDISNSSDETTLHRSDGNPRKTSINDVLDENAKPYRFNPNLLKVYTKKKGNKQIRKEPEVDDEATEEGTAEQTSISIMENSDQHVADIELFEDPEKMIEDIMASDEINLKKSKRKRNVNADEDSKKKKDKKIRLDPQAETWIQQFNDMCQQIDQHELDVE